VVPAAIVATLTLRRARLMAVGDPARVGLPGAVASVAGTALAVSLPSHVLRVAFAIAMAILGVRMLWSARRPRVERVGGFG
jgi:uncharacterized membrane protein YfcA